MPNHSTEQLKSNIAGLRQEASALIDALNDEHRALQQNETDGLATITQLKADLIKNLQTKYEACINLCWQLGFTGKPEELAAFIEQLDRTGDLTDAWQSLDALIKEGQKQNEVNGAIIHLSQRQLNNTLEVLYGVTKEQKTYGASGESKPNHLPSFNLRV